MGRFRWNLGAGGWVGREQPALARTPDTTARGTDHHPHRSRRTHRRVPTTRPPSPDLRRQPASGPASEAGRKRGGDGGGSGAGGGLEGEDLLRYADGVYALEVFGAQDDAELRGDCVVSAAAAEEGLDDHA